MDYSIGELAELTGIPVKTIRFYSDTGVLPAPSRTSSGYRRYTDEHRVHLELVRTLREIGIDLATIRSLGHRDLKEVLALHLRAVETQITALQRTRAVLRVTLDKDAPAEEDLRRLHALGKLGGAEMAALLDTFIDDVGGDIRPRHEWLAAMREHMLPELPAEPTTAQLDAWLELAELLADDDFRRRLREQSDGFWAGLRDMAAYHEIINTVMEVGLAAVEEGIPPDSPEARPVLERVLALLGQTREQAVRMFDEHDSRGERLWRLVAIVRDIEYDPRPGQAYAWIEQAARAATF
ncbi:MerR family transcriptional regulator [Thermopolyspora sp. NPDC052614]|uniref:helix-turn-helix domain-containing protein n=1 Tax=Thermopolyspora sp. NPDC052614 TaxID=3155682 RepID=UPI003441AC87